MSYPPTGSWQVEPVDRVRLECLHMADDGPSGRGDEQACVMQKSTLSSRLFCSPGVPFSSAKRRTFIGDGQLG